MAWLRRGCRAGGRGIGGDVVDDHGSGDHGVHPLGGRTLQSSFENFTLSVALQ